MELMNIVKIVGYCYLFQYTKRLVHERKKQQMPMLEAKGH